MVMNQDDKEEKSVKKPIPKAKPGDKIINIKELKRISEEELNDIHSPSKCDQMADDASEEGDKVIIAVELSTEKYEKLIQGLEASDLK